jgi:hypothetical protein
MQACDKYFAVPLWANIQEGLTLLADSDEKRLLPKTVQIVEMAKRTAIAMSAKSYLVLDAYFAVRPASARTLPKIAIAWSLCALKSILCHPMHPLE